MKSKWPIQTDQGYERLRKAGFRVNRWGSAYADNPANQAYIRAEKALWQSVNDNAPDWMLMFIWKCEWIVGNATRRLDEMKVVKGSY